MSLEDREKRLLDMIESYQLDQCDRLISRARNQTRVLIANSYRQARAHLHEVVVSERARAVERIRVAESELKHQQSQRRQRARFVFLGASWDRLEQALLNRWQNSATREQWMQGYLGIAQARLSQGAWQILHPPDWGTENEALCIQLLADGDASRVEFTPDRSIGAGLIIQRGGASLDASIRGLLMDRRQVEARMLFMAESEASQ